MTARAEASQTNEEAMSKRIWDDYLSERDRKVYETAGYGRRGGFGTRPALFVIDVQYNFCGDVRQPILEAVKQYRTACGEEAWDAVPHIERLMKICREKNLPIFYTVSERRPDTPIITGCTTSGCVRATAVDSFSYNFKVAIPEETTFDRFQSSHAMNLFDLNCKYADVIPTDDVTRYLEALPAREGLPALE